jgi:ABC transport system ATP-binding/permease protein
MMPAFAPPREQRRILAARYAATLRGDSVTVLLLVAQAPLIGWLCTLVWASVETDTDSLRFVLALSAVWFGCINACREIVKERAIVERERLLGLGMVPYVLSRLQVLAWLDLLQVLLMLAAVEWHLALRGAFVLQLAALWGAAVAGSALGLFVSALSSSQERAVGVVPLLLLPQILFSELAVPSESFTDVVAVGEKLMPAHWAFEVFTQLADPETKWGEVAIAFAAMPGMTAALALATILAMQRRVSVT